ncbi:hypothetical protein K0J07_002737 [Escherichia coli]|uniref:hypothetical protein n=1 Tax=Escherichia coli TaxID=562 RepID=UPI001768569F|nr:hypothetical protein [Escherichia coli]EFA4136988.1 hypothetical protein [Escherichia coli O8:H31]EEY8749388.1 hypothetical protein [Escherichia coli]EFI3010328.1 hypothetical protein [Escherichia coli]EFK7858253.1 hypothetical protein [Escherichia coli]EFT2968395.1 hypothetical protein [Escherichia coli]
MASPINSGIMMSNLCPSTFLDKNINVAAELDITNNEKKYSPGSNFAKWMLQEIKRLIANIMSGSRSVNTEILNYFHPMPGTENNGNRTWMAATGENEYTVIEQTGDKSFKVIQFDAGEKNTKKIVKETSYSGVGVATIIKSLSEKTAALETHSADTVLRKKLVNSIVMMNTDCSYEMPADIVSNTYDLLNLRIQKDEGHLPVQEKIDITEDYLHSMTMDAHRCIKEQTKPSGAAKITCCGVELSKDILKIFAEKIETIEKDPNYSQKTPEQLVAQVCFKDDDCARVRELLKKSNGNITDDKIDEIVACLASRQGITCFYYSSAQGYQSRLQHTSQDVRELLSKSFDSFILFTTDLKKSGNAFFGSGKYLNEMDFTMNGFSQKIYLMAVNKNENEVNIQCVRYITTGSVDEQNTISDKTVFKFFGAATTADL